MKTSRFQKSGKQSSASQNQSDYVPLAAPPNPRADEAREAKRAYMMQLQVNAAPIVEAQAVDVDAEPPAPEPCGEETEQDKIAAALARWPDLARYASTARIETLTVTLPGDVPARGEVVTVTCFEKKGERE